MKAYLISYDLNSNGYKSLLKLVYADSYEEAVEKLTIQIENNWSKDDYVRIINHNNLTIF